MLWDVGIYLNRVNLVVCPLWLFASLQSWSACVKLGKSSEVSPVALRLLQSLCILRSQRRQSSGSGIKRKLTRPTALMLRLWQFISAATIIYMFFSFFLPVNGLRKYPSDTKLLDHLQVAKPAKKGTWAQRDLHPQYRPLSSQTLDSCLGTEPFRAGSLRSIDIRLKSSLTTQAKRTQRQHPMEHLRQEDSSGNL